MRNKNNWSHKSDFKTERVFEKLIGKVKNNKPMVSISGNVLWGTSKNNK